MAPVAAAHEARKLRIALLVDSPLQPRWAAEAFARLAAAGVAGIVAVIECGAARSGPPRVGSPRSAFWALYAGLDRRAFGMRPDPMERVPLKEALPPCAWLPPEAAAQAQGVDVAFVLGDLGDVGEAGAMALPMPARYGVWRYFFGSQGDDGDAHAGTRELLSGAAATPSGVKARLRPGERERILYQSWSRVFDYSLARTRDNQLPKAASFAARALARLQEGGEAWLRACAPVPPARAERPDPSMLAAPLAARALKACQQRLGEVSQWFLAYRFSGGARSPHWAGDLTEYACLVPPKDRFWADPFPLERDGRHYVFFEELVFARRRAHISVMEVRRDGTRSAAVKVLERPYHLSYPFLFEHAGALFMIPETGDNRTVEVYRCRRFPDEWTQETVLLEGGFFTDATLHRAHDRWWMFANLSPDGTQGADELNLYHAADPLGRWTPHRMNPVKSDIRGARPAGGLYEAAGALYRPGQIGAPIYGRGVSINRVVRLSPEEYRETEVQRVLPTHPREVLGVHTVNRAGDLAVMDGFLRRPRIGAWRGSPLLREYAHGH
jgi:hypothetical protein